MKSLTIFCTLVVVLSGFASLAKADILVNWSFYLETYGSRAEDGPTPTFIDPGYLQYPYDWDVTGAQMRLAVDNQWYDVLPGMPAEYKSGSGTLVGPLPVVDWPVLHIDSTEITADILVSVDASGYGTLAIGNIEFGELQGWPVNGAKFWVDVTATPEPCTLLLLGLGAVMVRRKR